jgi:RimJ/RimL family protein N-acetyltransferase
MLNLTADILQGRYVRLEPITIDHRDELKAAIDCDPESWEIMSVNGCGEGFDDFWGSLEGETDRGERIGFAVRRLSDGKVIGTSSYLNIRRLHGGLEIGSTFLNPDARSGPINPESKRLMLAHAFEKAGAIRVEFNHRRPQRPQPGRRRKAGRQQGRRAAQPQGHLDRPRARHRGVLDHRLRLAGDPRTAGVPAQRNVRLANGPSRTAGASI